VETDGLLAAIEPTRVLRRALDVLWSGLPFDTYRWWMTRGSSRSPVRTAPSYHVVSGY
jgi:hypothetical protein